MNPILQNLSRGATRLLNLLRSYAARSGQACPLQSTLHKKLSISIRMVQYYVAELRKAGLIEVKRRAGFGKRVALYILRVVGENCGSGFGSGFGSEVPVPITEQADLQREQPAPPPLRKPPQPETLPDSVRQALHRAADRIRRAFNPFAYRQAIIEAELKAESLSNPSEPIPESKPVVAIPAGGWTREMGVSETWPPEELNEFGIPLNWTPVPFLVNA